MLELLLDLSLNFKTVEKLMLNSLNSIHTCEAILSQVKKNHPDVSVSTYKFKHLAAAFAEKCSLPQTESLYLASSLGLKLYPRPQGIPETWITTLCKSFLSQKYINPVNPLEYTIVMPPDSFGRLPYVLQHTPGGWADARWFLEIIPELQKIINDNAAHRPFSVAFNHAFNANKSTPGQIRALNLFFEKYVPGVEGICATCYQVSLPKSGAGERWHQIYNGNEYEVRLSAAKTYGHVEQKTEYISQTIIDQNKQSVFAMWDPQRCNVQYTNNMKQGPTHIPWDIYDYNKFNIRMPGCQCKNQLKHKYQIK